MKLLPCPFCGSPASGGWTSPATYQVGCDGLDCTVQMVTKSKRLSERLWNRRTKESR